MKIFAVLAIFVVLLTIGSGIYIMKSNEEKAKLTKKTKMATYLSAGLLSVIVISFLLIIFPDAVSAANSEGIDSAYKGLAYLAAGLSTGLAAIGAGYAVAVVGAAALGALSEDPSVFGKTLIYVGLAEGIAIYGLIISIMILSGL